MRSLSVYLRRGSLLVVPMAETVEGLQISVEPALRASMESASPEAIGTSLVDWMKYSREGVPHPSDWSSVRSVLLEAAKVKSWATFVKGARLLSCCEEPNGYSLTPYRNLGAKEGFLPLQEDVVVVAASAPAPELGAAVMKMLAAEA